MRCALASRGSHLARPAPGVGAVTDVSGHQSPPPSFVLHRTVRVMTFNVLARIWEPDHLPDKGASFAKRFPTICGQIDTASPDVAFLQEVEPSTAYRARFGAQYHILFASKAMASRAAKASMTTTTVSSSGGDAASESAKCASEMTEQLLGQTDDGEDGAALLLRKSSMELVEAHIVTCFDPFMNQHDTRLLPSARVARQFALLALCRHIPTGEYCFVAGMHMKANGYNAPTDTEQSEDWRRVGHARQILERFQAIRGGRMHIPFIFGGDFNAQPHSTTVDYLVRNRAVIESYATAGGVTAPPGPSSSRLNRGPRDHGDGSEDSQLLSRTIHHQTWLHFESALAMARPTRDDPEFTLLVSQYNAGGWSATLDYILLEKGRFIVTSAWDVPPRALCGADAIPYSGSDHLPLVVDVAFLH